MAPDTEKLHIATLSKDIDRATASIRESFETTLKELVRLHKIIPRPGWTTPAEFLLVRAGIASASSRAQSLSHDVTELVNAADKVGQAKGVVITEG